MKASWVEINLGVLDRNIQTVKQVLGDQTEIIFVVKADAYGHGLPAVARQAAKSGIRRFAVAYLQEALELRKVVDEQVIHIIGVVGPEDVPVLLEKRLTPITVSLEHARALSTAAEQLGERLPVHVKIDTGMGRLGVFWPEAVQQGNEILKLKGLDVRGICSHFAAVKPEDPSGAEAQVQRFTEAADALEAAAGRKLYRHISSSRATLLKPEWNFDGVRLGIMLYGYGAGKPDGRIRTHPILQWKTHVVQVRSVPADFPVGYYSTYRTDSPTDLAVIALGYADGYLRTLSNRGHVLIGGNRCPVVGRVSMNWISVDLGPDSSVKAGDEVVLIGEQAGASIWADELALICRTIPYEILTGIHAGIERRYAD